MAPIPAQPQSTARQDAELALVVKSERARLWRYVRRRVGSDADAEDILQDVFGELVEAYRALLPIQRLGAWLMRVARNRLIDRFRARVHTVAARTAAASEDFDGSGDWESLLPDPGAGPEAAYARETLLGELAAALEQLPAAQRETFIAHELAGESFAAMSARTGVAVNTLLARKHYAVQYLRRRLAAVRADFLDLAD